MKLSDWMKKTTSKERRQVAKEAGCTSYYFYYIAKNRCSAGLAKKIEDATQKITPDRVVFKEELRPDIWGPE